MTPEGKLTAAVKRVCKRRGAWNRKIAQGIHGAGFPDVVVGYRGVSMFWEIKVPGNPPTKLQAKVHEEMRKVGMIVRVVERADQADKIFDAIDRRRDNGQRRPR